MDIYKVDLNDRDEQVIEALKDSIFQSLMEVINDSFIIDSKDPSDDEVDFIHELVIDAISNLFVVKMVEVSMKNCSNEMCDYKLIDSVIKELKESFINQIKLKRSEIN